MSVATKREEGAKKSKQGKRKGEEKGQTGVMFVRNEDNETCVWRQRVNPPNPVGEYEDIAVPVAVAAELQPDLSPSPLYPPLHELNSPPPYIAGEQEEKSLDVRPKHILRYPKGDKSKVGDWSSKLGRLFSPVPSAPPAFKLDEAEQFPMIEVPNPNEGQGNQGPTMLVFSLPGLWMMLRKL